MFKLLPPISFISLLRQGFWALLLLYLFLPSSSAHSQATASISGTVVDEDGVPMYRTRVELYKSNQDGTQWPEVVYAFTDESGYYQLPNLSKGRYRIRFVSEDHVIEHYNNRASGEEADTIEFATDTEVFVADAVVTRYGVITGRVTDVFGAPIKSVSISPYRQFENNRWSAGSVAGRTDANGNYRIYLSPNREYRLRFVSRPLHVEEIYDNVTSVEAGQSFTVPLRATIPNINVQLDRYGLVTGKVTDLAGQPIANAKVEAYIGNTANSTGRSTVTDAFGNYQLILRPEYYSERIGATIGFSHVSYQPEFYNDQLSVATATTFTAPLNSVAANINAQLAPGPLVSGTVTDNRGALRKGIDVQVHGSQGPWTPEQHPPIRTDENGHYAVRLAPGSYRLVFDNLAFDDPTDLDSIDYIGKSHDFAVTLGNDVTLDVDLAIIPSISGRATFNSGHPGVFDPSLFKRMEIDGQLQWNCCHGLPIGGNDTAGYYRIEDIEPGEYIVLFESEVFRDEYYHNQSTVDVDTATVFTVTPDSAFTNIDAVLNNTTGEVEAYFMATPRSGAGPLTVNFSDQSLGMITARTWDFGDGTTSSEVNPSHTYTGTGDYTVTLTVTGEINAHGNRKGGYISVSAPPLGNLQIQQSSAGDNPNAQPVVGQTLYFSATSTGEGVEYLWDFGDGVPVAATTAIGQYIQHSYNTPGNYTVSLIARSGDDEEMATLQLAVQDFQLKILMPRVRR